MEQYGANNERRSRFKRWLRIVVGSALIGLGVVGLFLPFLQGVLFIVVGLSVLSSESVWARRIHNWLRARWSHLREPAVKKESPHGVR
ncbi:MAG: hypothetical protein KatS3mg077_2765 [Candidatus Binatia bacterium]|nr:MAG: hypothetical protein KatS3mg077_2765 [Candidatus Binatia bacterium]